MNQLTYLTAISVAARVLLRTLSNLNPIEDQQQIVSTVFQLLSLAEEICASSIADFHNSIYFLSHLHEIKNRCSEIWKAPNAKHDFDFSEAIAKMFIVLPSQGETGENVDID